MPLLDLLVRGGGGGGGCGGDCGGGVGGGGGGDQSLPVAAEVVNSASR